MGSKSWTPERKKRFQATMAAKRAGNGSGDASVAVTHHKKRGTKTVRNGAKSVDIAIGYLEQARDEGSQRTAKHEEPDKAHLLTLLALKTLRGF